MKKELVQRPSGLIVPTEVATGVHCGFCPAIIFKHNEARGRLFLVDGKAMCARCRVLKHSKLAPQIRRDKKKFDADVVRRNTARQEAENEKVRNLAFDTQVATGTMRKSGIII